MSKKRKIVMIGSIFLVLALIVAFGVWKQVESNLETLKETPLTRIDFSRVADGAYRGEYSIFPVSAEVEVTISGGTIKEIEIVKHGHGRGEEGEKVAERVLQAESLEVDTVSGATYSSLVILKAIEQALLKAEM